MERADEGPLRVLVLMSGIALGGGERNVTALLAHLGRAGAEPTLCTLNERRDSSLVADFAATGVERRDLGARRMLDPAAWLRFRALLRDGDFDLVHSQDQDTHVYGASARRVLGTPFVMTRHVMAEPTGTPKLAARARLVLWAARFAADRVIAVSDAVHRSFEQQAHLPRDRVTTVHNGIDVGRFGVRTGSHGPRSALGWPVQRPVVTMVAVLRPGKGHDLLLESLPRLRSAVPDVAVKIVGAGPDESQIRRDASSLGDAVDFLGERADIPRILAASDVVVLPSRNEGFPTVLLEAGAVGVPVVATRVGGTGEIVEDGHTGFLVEAGDVDAFVDRVARILRDRTLATEMGGEASRLIRSRFSLSAQAEGTVSVYREVLADR